MSKPPIVFESVSEMQRASAEWKQSGKRIGVVPTMGALHAGHLSLAKRSRELADVTVATIFVNPTQFAPGEDLDQYPRTFQQDVDQLAELGVECVFAPAEDEMYPLGCTTQVLPPQVALPLEGTHRSTHFQGVTTVVAKLLQITRADIAFFGQKDYQQSLVIQQMVRDLNFPTEISICPIVRDADGLALSSRNVFLSGDERKKALAISQTLKQLGNKIEDLKRDHRAVQAWMASQLAAAGIVEMDYALVADANTLETKDTIEYPAVGLIAAKVGATRLIDNALFAGPDEA